MSAARVSEFSKATDFISVGELEQVELCGQSVSTWFAPAGRNTIVFFHGNSACKEVFHHQMSAFHALGYSVLALDLPGHGLSDNAAHPEKTYTCRANAQLVVEAIAHFNLEHYLFVGWSLGGHLAIELLGQGVPAQGLCIMGTPPMGPGESMTEAFLPTPSAFVTGTEQVSEAELLAYVRDVYGTLEPIPTYFWKAAKRTDGKARAVMLQNWLETDEGHLQRAVIAESPAPLMVIHGGKEAFASYDYMLGLSWSKLWRDKFTIIEAVGHAPFLEAPDVFNRELAAFAEAVFA